MAISASQVKDLRERTGLGMMECKQALVETDGDMDAAIELLRMKAGAKVEKKAGRTAADGVVRITITGDGKTAAMVEVNSETDFVAKGDEFQAFAQSISDRIAASNPADVAALSAMPLKDGADTTVEQARESIVQKLGENMAVRRFISRSTGGLFGSYIHGNKIGVLVELEGGDETLARDIAMHIAASRPEFVSADDVSAEVIAKEKEIFAAQAKESGKPDDIIEKMVTGRISKFVNEITLLGQPFVKDPDLTVEKLLAKASAKVLSFTRYEVGEGIEKEQGDFAAEVMAQVKGG
ncbi:MAG: translation elongation factor Ts [Gammaproteobacteria bacterium]|nr:translation elongation factor Ts [Gammaproteobacteria bacterium]